MSEWDELADKFKRDREDAILDKERWTQEHRLVEEKGPALWTQLVEETSAAVNAINAAEGSVLSLVGPDPLSGKDGIEVLYYRPSGQRMAGAIYAPSFHTLTISIEKDRRVSRLTFRVVATNDTDVEFSGDGGYYKPSEIVSKMLAALL